MKLSLSLPRLKAPARTKTVVGLQFTQKVIRLVELNKEKKPVGEAVEVDLDGRNREVVLKEVVQRYGLAGKEVVACVPVDDGLLKFYKYPSSMSKKDLQSAIEWSIRKELSAFKEETYYDYYILEPKKEEKQIGVVLVFSRKETVEEIKRTIEACGLRLRALDYEVTAIINYGLYHKLPAPFSILYVDYDYSILATYTPTNIAYYVTHWSYKDFLAGGTVESLEGYFAEIRNIVVLNDLSSIYLAGPVIGKEEVLSSIMESLPVLGLLDIEFLKPNFFVPYMLSIRGLEG